MSTADAVQLQQPQPQAAQRHALPALPTLLRWRRLRRGVPQQGATRRRVCVNAPRICSGLCFVAAGLTCISSLAHKLLQHWRCHILSMSQGGGHDLAAAPGCWVHFEPCNGSERHSASTCAVANVAHLCRRLEGIGAALLTRQSSIHCDSRGAVLRDNLCDKVPLAKCQRTHMHEHKQRLAPLHRATDLRAHGAIRCSTR